MAIYKARLMPNIKFIISTLNDTVNTLGRYKGRTQNTKDIVCYYRAGMITHSEYRYLMGYNRKL